MCQKTLSHYGKQFLRILTILMIGFLLSGCGLTAGNADSDIEAAVQTFEEQYGIDVKITNKALFPGGVLCDVTVRCDELADKDIRIFWYSSREQVQSDYIFVKYGDDAYDKICSVVNTVLPDSKVVVEDFGYNHFFGNTYDKDTTFEDYLQKNKLKINIIVSEEYNSDKIRSIYTEAATALIDAGINSDELSIYRMDSKASADAVKTYEHIPDSQRYVGIPDEHVVIRASNRYGDLQQYIDDQADPNALFIYVFGLLFLFPFIPFCFIL